MDLLRYQREAQNTKSTECAFNPQAPLHADLLHASMGLVTEAGEFQDALKKVIFYGQPYDRVNLKEELGDMLWYMAIAAEALGTDIPSLAEINNKKLRLRFPASFSKHDAEHRDLFAERKLLEMLSKTETL